MWHRTDAVLARADVRGHMASNTTEEPKVPQVVSAYSEKKSRAMWHRTDAVLARADVRGHMASNEAWNRRFRRWCLLIQESRAMWHRTNAVLARADVRGHSTEGKMVIKDVNLETVCGITSVIPLNLQPEFAFAGKSNVGKSSLINGLMNRKSYARISAEPGKTQTINFYHINDTFYLVDLPGYGYANRSKDEVRKWGTMVENYLHRSRMLRLVFLLIDIRHEASENDHMMYDWILHQGFEPIIIATKADKIKKTQLQKQISLVRNSLGISPETVLIPYSAVTKQGREEIYAVIEQNMQAEMTSID